MRKLADLYFDKRPEFNDLGVKAFENMKTEDQGLVEDLMRNFKIQSQINNACKDVMRMNKGDVDINVATFDVNIGNTSIETKVKVEIVFLKSTDTNDLRISLYSLVNAPNN